MGWGNIYKRRVKVFAVALIIYFDYKALQQREKWANKLKIASLWEKAHERNAKRVLNLIVDLEGLWVKLGQYLSTRADVLPEAYTLLLKQLQDSLPPRSLKEVCKTIEKELGKTMDDLFLYFDKVPLATASIAQVHRATLSDGQEVVVKVQHDGIKAVILEDLKNAKSIVDWIAWAEPQYNFHPMIDEWCNESPKELDFNHEAENTRKVSRNLHCNKRCDDSNPANHVDVLIPEVIQSTEKVLVLEYMDGVRLNDAESLQALGVDKQKLVEEITRAYAHQIYVDGFFNGDPHPGNFLVSKEPPHRPILLDFGLTKLLSSSLKQALAKMFLAAAEGDHVALLAAFAEMGLKFRLDVPEQAMEVTSVFFRSSTPANEALESMKMLSEQRLKNIKVIQEKMKLNEKEVKRFNPVDAFPSDIVIFGRVLNLLRGLSATMNVRIVYIEIMRPFAESVLQCNLNREPALNPRWIYDTPIHSDVEAKLRQLLVELGNAEKILGIQVCAYKDGEVIIDTAAGVLGKYDPRPVQPDSLFSVFSATKGICAGLVHWLVDNGKLKLEDNIANIWPEFGSNGKDQIKVHHVLNHTSGLHSAMSDINQEDPFLMTDWDECLKRIAMSAPETAPGREQLYHYLSFGWLCGGIIERASGRRFQELLEEVFVRPLKIDGELYVGIPPGVESRLATLTIDMSDLTKLSNVGNRSDLPTTFQPQQMAQLATTLPAIFNSLYARRAIIPAANGHCSARALARYYAALAEGGKVPPPHHSSMPTLGSHPHIPKFPSQQTVKKQKSQKKTGLDDQGPGQTQSSNLSTQISSGHHDKGNVYIQIPSDNRCSIDDSSSDNRSIKLFHNPKVHDAFMGVGEYENLTYPNGMFGLGFKRSYSTNEELIGFGHSGIGGSTGLCNIEKATVFENLDELNDHGLDPVGSGKGSPLSSIQDAASPAAAQSSSVSFEQPDLLGAAPEHLSREAPSPSSVMDTHAVRDNANSIGYDSNRMRNLEQLKVPGLRPSMSMTDLVSHFEICISQQINSGSLQSDEALECKGMLEDIAQMWLSDTQCTPASDEKSLMKKVNSLCCLLQDPIASHEPHLNGENHLQKPVQSNDACSSSACENDGNNKENTNDSVGSKPTPSIPRIDSFGDLLLHLPRIASLPKFLFNIVEDDENQSR